MPSSRSTSDSICLIKFLLTRNEETSEGNAAGRRRYDLKLPKEVK
jgi:hypothetical protein